MDDESNLADNDSPWKEENRQSSINNRQSARSRILFADDNEEMRAVVEAVLRNSPWRIDVAHDGEEALERYDAARAEDDPYTLLVLDGAMPKLCGFQVAERIRAAGDDRTLIRFLTAYSDAIAQARARSNHAEIWTKSEVIAWLPDYIAAALNDS